MNFNSEFTGEAFETKEKYMYILKSIKTFTETIQPYSWEENYFLEIISSMRKKTSFRLSYKDFLELYSFIKEDERLVFVMLGELKNNLGFKEYQENPEAFSYLRPKLAKMFKLKLLKKDTMSKELRNLPNNKLTDKEKAFSKKAIGESRLDKIFNILINEVKHE